MTTSLVPPPKVSDHPKYQKLAELAEQRREERASAKAIFETKNHEPRNSLEPIYVFVQKLEIALGMFGRLIAFIMRFVMSMWLGILAYLIFTFSVMAIILELYSSGFWTESDVWALVLLLGAVTGVIASFIALMNPVGLKVYAGVLNSLSILLLVMNLTYQSYKSDPESVFAEKLVYLFASQFYLVSVIILLEFYLLGYFLFSGLKWLGLKLGFGRFSRWRSRTG